MPSLFDQAQPTGLFGDIAVADALMGRAVPSPSGAGRGIWAALAASLPPDQLARAGIMPTGTAQSYQPTRGEDAAAYLRQQGYVGGRMAPVAGAVLDYGGIPAEIATNIATQPVRAGEAVGEAAYDPTLANVTNAGVQTALAFGRPVAAGAALAGGLTEGIRRDFAPDIFSSADAQSLTRRQKREMEMQDRQAAREREAEAARIKLESEARRGEADAAAKRAQAEADANRRRGEDAAAVDRATAEMQRIMAKDTRFEDTNIGKIMHQFGGYDPAAAGVAAGLLTPKGGGFRGYGMPALMGAAAGIAASNGPLVYDAYRTPVLNPEREAYQAGVRLLPEDHQDVRRYKGFLEETNPDGSLAIPVANPVRTEAQNQLGDWWGNIKRVGLGALEGAGGGLLGHDATKLPERLAAAPRNLWRAATGRVDGVGAHARTIIQRTDALGRTYHVDAATGKRVARP